MDSQRGQYHLSPHIKGKRNQSRTLEDWGGGAGEEDPVDPRMILDTY